MMNVQCRCGLLVGLVSHFQEMLRRFAEMIGIQVVFGECKDSRVCR